jgi:hypothetical protein
MPSALPIRLAAGLLAVLSAAAAIACGDPLAPEEIAGIYALQRVEADHLPTVLYTNEFVRVRVLADTIRLRADGTGMRFGVWEFEPLQEGLELENPASGETDLRFETVGANIEIAFVCPPNANCLPPPHLVAGKLSEGLLVNIAPGQRVRLPLLYARVAGSD